MDRLAPILTNFEHDPRDVRWLGDPVDLIIFEGYGKSKDSKNIEDFNLSNYEGFKKYIV